MDIKPPKRTNLWELPTPELPPEPEAPLPTLRVGKYSFQITKQSILYASFGLMGVIVLGVIATVVMTKVIPAKTVANLKGTKQFATPTPKPEPSVTPEPPPSEYPLTGLPATGTAAQAPIAGIMIENLYPDARPQSGLSQAGIVYEALAEGGITRFLALFQEPYPGNMGPVRSLRDYYLDWGLEYDAPVAHAGGSEDALKAVIPRHLKDINALLYDGKYFLRTRDRVAPHNLYTNPSLLTQVLTALNYNHPPTFTPLPRKADPGTNPTPSHPTIRIPFSYAAYNAEYRYNPANNDYLRFEGGAAQIDRNNGHQIEVKNLVIEYVPVSYGTQSNGKPDTNYDLIGSGRALVFMDGGFVAGSWSKASHSAPTIIKNDAGEPVQFNRGNTWYSVVPTGTNVTY